MTVRDKIISFWKQVRLKSSDMFTLFKVGIGVKVPTHKLHVKNSTDPIKVEGLQNDTTDPDKFLTIDSSNVIKYRTGTQVLSDIGGTPLTTEQVQDIAGALVATGGTKTGITVTYQDATGDMDFAVDHDAATNFVANEHIDWTGASAGTIHATNYTNTTYSEATGSAEGLMSVAHHDKLDGIESSADVTDATNVTAAGALMDSELTDLAGIKSLDTSTLVNLSGTQTIAGGKTFTKPLILDGDKSVTAGSDGVSMHVDAQDITDTSTSGSGTATTFNHIVIENPRLMATNSSVTTTNASTLYIKGAPIASTNQTITNAYSLYVAGGLSYFGGDLSLTGNILPGINKVKIFSRDFIPDDAGRPAMIDDTGSDRWLESHGTAKLYANVEIPLGFKATHVHIYGSATSAITVYEADVNSKTVTSKGTGNIGTNLDITDVEADSTNYILIELVQASGEEVYGGIMTIAKV
tara:strand:- start:164 stop:1561 length:1398 start_codon:yes stop_codon:yes gene_type:complete